MGDTGYTHGSPRAVVLAVGKKRRKGNDLSDVLRDVLRMVIDEQEWAQADVGEHLGMAQSTISRFLAGESPAKLTLLTNLCIVLDESPISLLARHPLYQETARGKVTFPKDHTYRKFQRILQNSEARDLVDALGKARTLGVLGEAIEALGVAVTAAAKAVAASASSRRRKA